MAEQVRMLLGSETQNIEGHSIVTGVQRVVREAHVALTDVLTPRGVTVAPLHTHRAPRQRGFRGNPYLAADPVLDQPPVRIEDVDAAVFLDLHAHANYARVFRERRRRPLPVISLVHDILPITHPEWWHDDPDRAFRIYLQQLLAVSDHIIVTSEAVRADIEALGWRIDADIHTVPLGSSFGQAPRTRPDDGRISVLYVSTVEPRKGHDILLGAFDLLRADGHDIDLTIVGHEGWKCDDIVAALRTHPDFGGRLRWLDSADDLTVRTLARSCSIGVFPTSGEGFGFFLEEGLTHGLSMVVSDIPVLRERAQPNVHYCARTPQAFAEGILRAHRAPWVAAGHIRTMHDFGLDLADLVGRVLKDTRGGSARADAGLARVPM